MTPDVQFRWVKGWEATDDEWNRVESIVEARGWMTLNKNTTRILLAETAVGVLAGFLVLQAVPHAEPMFVAPSFRGSGVAEELSERMQAFMAEVKIRGWMVVAETPFAEKLCEAGGMTRVDKPVYVKVN